jgi:amidase
MLKDNIVTLDRMEATAGSFALLGAKPAHESTVATKLREAGAILLGKVTLTEWANYRWTNAATGWCARGGQCTGPFYPKMKASGSSTGCGVATALGLTFAAIGTEVNDPTHHYRTFIHLTSLRLMAAFATLLAREIWLVSNQRLALFLAMG